MDVSAFDFSLPPELIAQEPPHERGAARLLHLDRRSGGISHTSVSDLPGLLRAGDLVVVNNTRVFPARLLGRRDPSGGAVECLLIGRLEGERWEALVHPGQKLKPGARVVFEGERRDGGAATLRGEVLERHFFGRRVVRLWTDGPSVDETIDAIGHVPLPPYIKRADRPDDRERYQTVFARTRGSVAAPTAGLHFTPALVDALRRQGVALAEVTLHVGYGTFQPVRTATVEDHRLEAERYEIAPEAAAAVNCALDEGRRVIAVGTTTTRTLEEAGRVGGGRLAPGRGATDLFIYPGFEFRVISALLTNFHLPQSSLLMLVSAFAGGPSTGSGRVLAAYGEAIARGYRFYSYGDAMLVD